MKLFQYSLLILIAISSIIIFSSQDNNFTGNSINSRIISQRIHIPYRLDTTSIRNSINPNYFVTCKDGDNSLVGVDRGPNSPGDSSDIFIRSSAIGLDYYSREVATGSDYCTDKVNGHQTDTGEYVVEVSCLEDQRIYYSSYKCPEGFKCLKGACDKAN